jgi:hypothetical protein
MPLLSDKVLWVKYSEPSYGAGAHASDFSTLLVCPFCHNTTRMWKRPCRKSVWGASRDVSPRIEGLWGRYYKTT